MGTREVEDELIQLTGINPKDFNSEQLYLEKLVNLTETFLDIPNNDISEEAKSWLKVASFQKENGILIDGFNTFNPITPKQERLKVILKDHIPKKKLFLKRKKQLSKKEILIQSSCKKDQSFKKGIVKRKTPSCLVLNKLISDYHDGVPRDELVERALTHLRDEYPNQSFTKGFVIKLTSDFLHIADGFERLNMFRNLDNFKNYTGE